MKKIILSAMLSLGLLSASAQEQQGTTEYVFNPHWYVQVQPLGAQYTLGEADFSKLLSYNVQGAVGYNFSKILGARLALNAWQSKAGISNGKFCMVGDNIFRDTWAWKYVAPSLDLTVNLTNLAGFNPKRFFNLSAFVGGGVNFAFGNDDAQAVKAAYAKVVNFKGNENMGKVIDAEKTCTMNGQTGYIYEITYTAIDYFGKVAIKKYYVRF